ncbi:capsular biosynthesis protein [Chromobacterium vaccinii]|uniref:capsule biosynthesis protein n=1 Tax=Chromobacterium piscinae TaxID=686831 RepID=UPI00140955F1|nr:capsular biosynthesis protein [Chromobacterium vaccinii]MBX9359617.1 capsular biosynthesis protein [Chromobacterium vaccinii]NHQ81868.1 capsular biosynthesis protein [Chromobacterium vaccinii]
MLAAQPLLKHRRLLLLQGPMGPFFNLLADWLGRNGVAVHKLNFNGGDRLYHRRLPHTDYRGRLEDFAPWLTQHLRAQRIDGVVCFGDCRRYHQIAAEVCRGSGLSFYAFEEGYLRPDYITLESGGVNAYSKLADDPVAILEHEPSGFVPPLPTHPSFRRMAITAMSYYAAGWLWRRHYPHYHHHKDFSPFRECGLWLRSGWRKQWYRISERDITQYILTNLKQRYYLVPLQVFNDSQILQHSHYGDVSDFIEDVVTSFARHAPTKHHLVLKHHPMDRGHCNYRHLIQQLARQAGIADRVHYLHDAHLPSLLKQSLGVVVVNSTVGLSALHHGKPLVVTGRALYDMDGLTFQHGLDRFWRECQPPQRELYGKLRSYLLKHTQLNGAFFGVSHWLPSPSKVSHLKPALSSLLLPLMTILLIEADEAAELSSLWEWLARLWPA